MEQLPRPASTLYGSNLLANACPELVARTLIRLER
jgi:hypothetical protein